MSTDEREAISGRSGRAKRPARSDGVGRSGSGRAERPARSDGAGRSGSGRAERPARGTPPRGGPPATPPIGLQLSRTARAVTNAFERAMAEAGGSASAWQVLVLVRAGQWGTQAQMAEAMGITGATLTHHLNALEDQGLVRRWREASNRRVQQVALTEAGEALFDRLRDVAMRHDERLRSGLNEKEVEQLGRLLDKVRAGVES